MGTRIEDESVEPRPLERRVGLVDGATTPGTEGFGSLLTSIEWLPDLDAHWQRVKEKIEAGERLTSLDQPWANKQGEVTIGSVLAYCAAITDPTTSFFLKIVYYHVGQRGNLDTIVLEPVNGKESHLTKVV